MRRTSLASLVVSLALCVAMMSCGSATKSAKQPPCPPGHRCEAVAPLEAEPAQVDPDPLAAREEAARVRAALSALAAQQQEVIELHWFEGLAFKEIAARVGASLSAVNGLRSRGGLTPADSPVVHPPLLKSSIARREAAKPAEQAVPTITLTPPSPKTCGAWLAEMAD